MKHSILMLEHDDDDRYITRTVFAENNYNADLHFVNSSDDLFSFLFSCAKTLTNYPTLILLNDHARPMNALEIAKKLKSDPALAHIPIIVLSEAADDRRIQQYYSGGVSSVIVKPSSGEEIGDKIATFVRYWFETVALPV